MKLPKWLVRSSKWHVAGVSMLIVIILALFAILALIIILPCAGYMIQFEKERASAKQQRIEWEARQEIPPSPP